MHGDDVWSEWLLHRRHADHPSKAALATRSRAIVCFLLFLLAGSEARAGFDHELALDQNGIGRVAIRPDFKTG
jgi:hypothetical protein